LIFESCQCCAYGERHHQEETQRCDKPETLGSRPDQSPHCAPRSQLVAGYEPLMPPFAGKVTEDDLVRLLAYIKSLAGAEQRAQ
jgi:hypothetical protein